MYDIVIIGAGPAGLTAAIYAKRAGKKVLVLEAKTYGGQIVNTLNIENYPAEEHISGYDFAKKLYTQAKNLGAEIVFEKVLRIENCEKTKKIYASENEYEAKAIIVATGSENRKLGVAGEDELIGKGISYCATCDGAFYKGKTVAVVGGGNTALEDALYLADIANKVYLIHRRNEFRGAEATVARLNAKRNVTFVLKSHVTKLDAEGKLKSIEVTADGGKAQTLEIDGLFVAIGREPATRVVAGLLELDDAGYVKASENCHTNVAGIFVAGDNRAKEVRQLVTATSDGAVAAMEAVKFVENLK
ncbi:thioredoxin-disulfide reductase [Candidatus Saccharibacteria bacterium]|nr:thioredoxin-disulfide reductase [Candidatus Saccharibacteria bacterium]